MKHLVVGAGATLAEAIAQGVAGGMASGHPRLRAQEVGGLFPLADARFYLETIGLLEPRADLRELFYELEAAGKTNIEQFMDFVWNRMSAPGSGPFAQVQVGGGWRPDQERLRVRAPAM